MTKRRCKCGHTASAHHGSFGKCRAWLCECGAFRRGAVLVCQPKTREQMRAELDLLAQAIKPEPIDELTSAALAVVAPHTHLRVWPSNEGVRVEYFVMGAGQGASIESVAGRSLSECLQQIVKHCT